MNYSLLDVLLYIILLYCWYDALVTIVKGLKSLSIEVACYCAAGLLTLSLIEYRSVEFSVQIFLSVVWCLSAIGKVLPFQKHVGPSQQPYTDNVIEMPQVNRVATSTETSTRVLAKAKR